MNIKTTIAMLQQTIETLSKLDPDTPVDGHISNPSNGYTSDLQGEITSIEIEPADEANTKVLLVVNYN